ncbi:hypothetical protein SLNSH_23530 [Alsobacter soli]|uniref:Uncharacterized protein n=1 Tax=Alsobacter soli TaxID=2109933 RepID=A0A2T1HLN3_9HYPH|nr:hypothetical protein [Alsobacter soli]PSC02546.1 hypothetical protein SLNSH_23530 [Alsobacter soli]
MKGSNDLKSNAEKAMRMKQQAGSQTTTPPHRTAREGAIKDSQVNMTDTSVGTEPTQTPNLKRSHNARSGDA